MGNETLHGTREPVISLIELREPDGSNPYGVIQYSQIGDYASVCNQAPEKGTESIYFPGMFLRERSFSTTSEGTTVNVVLTYKPNDLEVDDEDDQEPEYSLEVAPGEASLAEHPSLDPKQAAIVKALLDGVNPYDSVRLSADASGVLMVSRTDAKTPGAVPFQVVIDKHGGNSPIVLAAAKGKTKFRVASAVWTETTYKRSLGGLIGGIGKRDSPGGPNPGGAWLYMGASASKTKSDSHWRVTRRWEMGDNGNLDSDIY